VAPGAAVITSAGDILPPITHIIHAVGPIWQGGSHSEQETLTQAVNHSLTLAERHRITSLSMPAISSNIYGYPEDECSTVIVKAVISFFQISSPSSLKHLRLCDQNSSMAHLLAKKLMAYKDVLGKMSEMIELKQTTQLSYQWSWREDDGSFVPFDPDQNLQIELAFINQKKSGKMNTVVTGDLNAKKNGFSYEIDFDKMTEMNTHYRQKFRAVKRTPIKVTTNFQWEVEMQKGVWYKLDNVTNLQVEQAFFKKTFTEMSVVHQPSGKKVIINFASLQTVCGKKVNRADNEYEDKITSMQKRKSMKPKNGVLNVKEDIVQVSSYLIGPQKSIAHGVNWIQDKQKTLTVEAMVKFDPKIIAKVKDEIGQIKSKYDVTVKYANEDVTVSGIRVPVYQAIMEITQLIQKQAKESYSVPLYWVKQTDPYEMHPVHPISEKWKNIEAHVHQTLACNISRIVRVQNLKQWEKYCNERDFLQRHSGEHGEVQLFHGTKQSNPDLIIASDEGIDMRYSKEGMWGRACYFAENASYSHIYSYQKGKEHLMFLARVCIGRSYKCAAQRSLIKPPDSYDSVSGVADGSTVHMIYHHGRSYPEFLITYTI